MKIDGRKISRKAQEELRIRAVKQVESGASPEVVIDALGLHRSNIYRWMASYATGGEDALRSTPARGRSPKVSPQQAEKLCNILKDKTPLQLKFEFALWTRSMIQDLIKSEFGVILGKTQTGELLKKLGFTFQKPKYQADQQDPILVQKWCNEEYPNLVKRAKKEGSEIWFQDESGLRSDHHSGKTWAEKGKRPTIESTGSRFRINLFSAVNSRGGLRFMITEKNGNTDTFITFMRRLLVGQKKKIILIVDGHQMHKSKKTNAFLERNKERIELVFLPPYSPKINPDEWVWSHIKREVGRKTVSTKAQLIKVARSSLMKLQRTKATVSSFFRAPDTAYTMSTN